MRVSTLAERDDEVSIEVLGAAIEAGVAWLDTAPTYGWGEDDEHHNERVHARTRVDLTASTIVGGGRAFAAMAHALGSMWIEGGSSHEATKPRSHEAAELFRAV